MTSEAIMNGWIEQNRRFTLQEALEVGIPDEDINHFVVQWLIPNCWISDQAFPEYGQHISKNVLSMKLKSQITDLTDERLDAILQNANGRDILLVEDGTIIQKYRPSTGYRYADIQQ